MVRRNGAAAIRNAGGSIGFDGNPIEAIGADQSVIGGDIDGAQGEDGGGTSAIRLYGAAVIVHGNSLNPPNGGKACPFNQPVIGGDVDDVATDRKDERTSRTRAAIRLNSASAIGHCDVAINRADGAAAWTIRTRHSTPAPATCLTVPRSPCSWMAERQARPKY